MKVALLKSFIIFSSKGFKDNCSLRFPGYTSTAKGIPLPSMKRAIPTIGEGLFSLLTPYCLSSSVIFVSQKKLEQSKYNTCMFLSIISREE